MDIQTISITISQQAAISGIVGFIIAFSICMYESYLRKPKEITPAKPHPASIKWTKDYYASKDEPVPAHRIAQGYEQNDVSVVVAK